MVKAKTFPTSLVNQCKKILDEVKTEVSKFAFISNNKRRIDSHASFIILLYES